MAYKSALKHLEQANASCNFYCCRRTLIALNMGYLIVGIILTAVAAYAGITKVVTSLPVIGAIVTIGVFLIMVSIWGTTAAVCHSTASLFFYSIVMTGIFIMQFIVSIAALSINQKQEHYVMTKAWENLAISARTDIQMRFDCCGFDKSSENSSLIRYPKCNYLPCYNSKHSCPYCYPYMKDIITTTLKSAGGVGLFFSFFDILGIFFAGRLRSLENPSRLPSNYL